MKAKIVVLGNEKGGTGKSTLAMHLIVTWLREGKKVATLDLDGRQGHADHLCSAHKTHDNFDADF